VATAHQSSVVQQTYIPSSSDQDLIDALAKANYAQRIMASQNSRQNSITTVITDNSANSWEHKVKQVDARVDLLVPVIEKLARAVDMLAHKLDSLPNPRPHTRGDSSTTTAVSSGFTGAWRDHNNSFLSHQQLRRPSNLTSSRRPSAQTNITTPRSVAFADLSFKRDSGSSRGTIEEPTLHEVAELDELDEQPPRIRSRQLSRWDTETEDSSDDADSEIESPLFGGVRKMNIPLPPTHTATPTHAPPKLPVKSAKRNKKNLALRRPTGFPSKKCSLNTSHAGSPPAITMPTVSKHKTGQLPKPTTAPRSIARSEPSPTSTEPFHQPVVLDPDLISPPGPLPSSEQDNMESSAPGMNWAWGWPKRVVSGSAGPTDIENTSLNCPPTPITPHCPTSTAKMGLESIGKQKLAGYLTPPGLPPPRAGWYFFTGRAANPHFLQQLLGTEQPPVMQPALVWGHKRRYHNEGGNVAVEASVTECVQGDAWYVPKNEMASLLREWWGGCGDAPGVCGDGFVEEGVEIQIEPESERRGRRVKRWEDEDEEDAESATGVVQGRMFVWKGIGGVLTDDDGSVNGDDNVTTVDKSITNYS
jgi:hypothetical protein